MEQIPRPSHEVFSSKAPVGQKMAASAQGTASACYLRQDFQFGIPIYFCRGATLHGALPHRETSEMCFFCTSFCCKTAVPGLAEPKELSQPEGAPHTLPVHGATGRRWVREILRRERKRLQPHTLMVVIAALDRRTQPCPKPLCALVFIASRQTILSVALPRLASSLCTPPSKCSNMLRWVLSEGVKT